MNAPLRHASTTLLVAALFAAGCSSNSWSKRERTEELILRGQFREALEYAEREARENPGDEEADDCYRMATVAVLLERGRRLTFEGEDEAALRAIEQAWQLAPENEVVWSWLDKTRGKLSRSWYERAVEMHVNENLDGALEAYENSLIHDSEFTLAEQGLARVLIQMNHRNGLSDDYYNDGVRALQDYFLVEARARFKYSQKYKPGDPRPLRRSVEVDRLIAQRRLAVARSLESEELFAAARNEYKLALVMDPDNEEAITGRDRMEIEATASRFFESANMMILRGEWDRARAEIEKGREITVVQADRFDDILADIADARVGAIYESALNLEHDFRYEQAIKVYAQVLEEREWYEDAQSRLSTLTEYVASAEDLYTRARKAETDDERLQLLRQIEIFWPEYKDIQNRLDVLRKRIAGE